MANIAPTTASNAGAAIAFVATAPAGDIITPIKSGRLLVEFDNGHASPITITINPVVTTAKVPGAGTVSIPARSLVLAAGAMGVFSFNEDERQMYVNSAGGLPISYTGGNAALLVRAIQ